MGLRSAGASVHDPDRLAAASVGIDDADGPPPPAAADDPPPEEGMAVVDARRSSKLFGFHTCVFRKLDRSCIEFWCGLYSR